MGQNVTTYKPTKNAKNFFAFCILLGITISVFFLHNFFFNNKNNNEANGAEYAQAIKEGNIDTARNAPNPESIGTKTKNEAQLLFDIAHLQYSFRLPEKTVPYLVRILDSDSQEFESYKSIAAYSLLHTYYDTGGDIKFMVESIEKSHFMRNVTPTARDIFPGLFEKKFDEMANFEKELYLASYLIALGKRDDTVAMPANAALILTRSIVAMTKGFTEKKDVSLYEQKLKEEISIAKTRLFERLNSDNARIVSAHDTAVGLNLISITTDYCKYFKIDSASELVSDINILQLLGFSHEITRNEVPSLEIFTTYLNALFLARYLEDSEENNKKIDLFVQKITGEKPFEKVDQYSWASKRFVGAKEDNYLNFYRKQNLALIASRSTTLKEFLIMKDGWTDEDFLITN